MTTPSATAPPNPAGSPTNGGEKLTIPSSPAELEDLLKDEAKLVQIFQHNQLGDLIGSYARNVLERDQSIATQVREETQRVLNQMARDSELDGHPIRRPDLRVEDVPGAGRVRNTLYNPKAMGAAIDNEFEGTGDYFRAIWHRSNKDAQMQAKLSRVRNAFSSNVPSEGGFLIPETLRSELLRVSLETSIVRPRARTIPMESLRVPFPAVDSSSNVTSVSGGIVAYWTEESAALTASQAAFSRIILDAKKLTAYTAVPSELLSDSLISFEAFINDAFPQALGWYEDLAFISGDGVGKPLGFLNSPAAISVTKESGQLADTILWENIVKMYARMLPSSLGRAVWIASINTFPELATMALSVGTGGSAIWLNNGVEGPPMTILGRPVIFSEKVPPLGDAGDINFVDLGMYLIGDRQVMSAMSSEHFRFQNDETAFRVIERVDGRPWMQSAITPQNNGDTLSPFVKIAARA